MSEVSNPILGYANSYRLMIRMAEKEGKPPTVSMWSVITDLERNMAPLFTATQAELAALREDLATIVDNRNALKERLTAAEKRNAELVEFNDARERELFEVFQAHTTAADFLQKDYGGNYANDFVRWMLAGWICCAMSRAEKPTESGESE